VNILSLNVFRVVTVAVTSEGTVVLTSGGDEWSESKENGF